MPKGFGHQKLSIMNANIFRLTGLLYLMVILLAGFSQGYVRGTLIIPGDIDATAANILGNPELYLAGISFDLIAFILDVIISVLLYQMFKPFGKTLALASSSLRLIAHPAIGSLNLLNHYLSFHVLNNPDQFSSFSEGQLLDLSAMFIHAHGYGYMIAGGLFGVHCLLLGVLILKSNIIPNIFGGFLIASAAGYIIETFGNFNLPGYEGYTALIVGVSAAIGEVSFTIYLLIKGRQ
jgi:hypothetical protein